MEIKNGKKPLSAKPQPARLVLEDIFGNTLSLDPEIAKTIEGKGLSYRWISMRKWQEMGGSHDRAWRPIRRSECGNIGSNSISGEDPEGYIRRGDLVLAVRSRELNDKHKAYLRQESDRMSRIQGKQRQELAKEVESLGGKIKISEGYDDETMK